MSANNYIRIRKNEDGEYFVSEEDADTGFTISTLGKFLHPDDALDAAKLYEEENEVEYGIQFDKIKNSPD